MESGYSPNIKCQMFLQMGDIKGEVFVNPLFSREVLRMKVYFYPKKYLHYKLMYVYAFNTLVLHFWTHTLPLDRHCN